MVGFYAGLRRGERRAFLLGPYATKEEADANVARAHDAAANIDGRCWFDDAGSYRLEAHTLPPGRLNDKIGLYAC